MKPDPCTGPVRTTTGRARIAPRWKGNLMSRMPVKARILGATLAVAALGALGAGTAKAATTPSIANDDNTAIIATEGPGHTLQFYWQPAGTTP